MNFGLRGAYSKRPLSILYFLLYLLSITAIAPNAVGRPEIWTYPRFVVLGLILGLNVFVLIRRSLPLVLAASGRAKWIYALFGMFIAWATFSAIMSPALGRAHWGAGVYSTGVPYWTLLVLILATNASLAQRVPELGRAQLYGLFAGGMLNAVAVIIQSFDWTIDFTAHTSQLSSDAAMLPSTIFRGQMPIGFQSHRGHVGAVLATIAVLGLTTTLMDRGRGIALAFVVVPFSIASLLLVQTRASWLSAAVGIVIVLLALALKSELRVALVKAIVGIVVGLALGATILVLSPQGRSIPSLESGLNAASSGRLSLWTDAWAGVMRRPMLGWGSDGFGIWTSISRAEESADIEEVLSFGDSYFVGVTSEGAAQLFGIPTAKAHNVLLDTAVSYGIPGAILWSALILVAMWSLAKAKRLVLFAATLQYILFLGTWFDSAQYAHLIWWIVSINLAEDSEKPVAFPDV